MIHVAIDTSIYRQKPLLDSPEFKALAFLAKNKCICLHIPFFVENEFKSHIEAEQEKRLATVISILNKICDFNEAGPRTLELASFKEYLDGSKQEIVDERSDAFLKWASEVNAKRYSLSNKETNAALNAYFLGLAPLKEAKVRKDIPDSFIYQSLLKINDENSLSVVIEDRNLRGACNTAGMVCYSDLASFIESEKIKELLQGKIDNDVLGALESQIIEFLKQKELLIDKIEAELLSEEYSSISGDCIPGESNEIYLSGIDRPFNLNIGNNIEHYGDALFVVDFEADVELMYEYAVYRSDIYDLDPKKYHFEYLNDHYFNVETTSEFRFRGRIELNYELALESIESVAELLKNLSVPVITIEELDDFEINT